MNCEEIKKLINQPNLRCCSSCHTDYEDGYDDGICIYDENYNELAIICCVVKIEYEKYLESREK